MNFLKGKKTYILALAGALVWAAQFLGKIDAATAQQIYTILSIGSVAALRSAVNN